MKRLRQLLVFIAWLPVGLLAVYPWLPSETAGHLFFVGLMALPVWIYGVLTSLFLWRRSKQGSIAFAVCLLAGLLSVTHRIPLHFPLSEETSSSTSFRIVSWNAEGFRLNKEILAEASRCINDRQPDILCLQERPHDNLLAWDSIRAVFPAHPYTAINSREDEVLNLAVLSRWPLLNIREFYFENSYNKILQADIAVGRDTLRLFNVHLQTTGVGTTVLEGNLFRILQHNAVERNRQADRLAEAVNGSPYPVIVCGDFNDTPSSYAYRTMTRANLQDAFLQAGHGWGGSYQCWGGLFRIDYLFVSEAFRLLYYELQENNWSDHKMQVGEMRVK